MSQQQRMVTNIHVGCMHGSEGSSDMPLKCQRSGLNNLATLKVQVHFIQSLLIPNGEIRVAWGLVPCL